MESAPSFSLGLTQLTVNSEGILPNNMDPPKVVDHNIIDDSIDEITPEDDEVVNDAASSSKFSVWEQHAKNKKKFKP